MPHVNSKKQQKEFSRFLRKNAQIALMGTEFDVRDPFHKIYRDNRAHVLGALSTPELQLTKDAYEKLKKSKWYRRGQTGRDSHSLNAWNWLDNTYISPNDILKDQVTGLRSGFIANMDSVFDSVRKPREKPKKPAKMH